MILLDTESLTESGIFEEPEDFYKPRPEAHFTTYTRDVISNECLSKSKNVKLRLVGSSPLWGHLLWNAGVYTAKHLDNHIEQVKGKYVLELGAAAALPSIIAGLIGAKKVVTTDYPEPELLRNIQYNIDHQLYRGVELSYDEAKRKQQLKDRNVVAEGYIWGDDYKPLLSHLPDMTDPRFDLILLSDLVFNHSEHDKLLRTTKDLLAVDGKALVVFSPHRPLLLEADLKFFETAVKYDLVPEKIEIVNWKPMFEEDEDTSEIRARVYAYYLTHKP